MGFSQWTENFDSGTAIPAGWAVINNGDPEGWEITTDASNAQSADNYATIHWGSNAHDDYLITKAINVQAGISDRISFYVKSDLDFYAEDYNVLLSTTDQTAGSFTTTLQATQKAPDTWTKVILSLSAYVGQTVYVAVHATDTDQFYLFADTFVVDSAPNLSVAGSGVKKDQMQIYPNPFSDTVNISDISNVRSISIIDVSGRQVKTIENPTSSMQLGELNLGTYLLKVTMKDGSIHTSKIIKNK